MNNDRMPEEPRRYKVERAKKEAESGKHAPGIRPDIPIKTACCKFLLTGFDRAGRMLGVVVGLGFNHCTTFLRGHGMGVAGAKGRLWRIGGLGIAAAEHINADCASDKEKGFLHKYLWIKGRTIKIARPQRHC